MGFIYILMCFFTFCDGVARVFWVVAKVFKGFVAHCYGVAGVFNVFFSV